MKIMHKKMLLGSCLIAGWLWLNLAYAAEDSTSTSTTPAASALDTGLGDLQPPPPKKKPEPPPKKTEYDRLPYAELLDKANRNDLIAQFELGSRYNYGRSMPKDTAKALHWLRKAAKAGQKDALRLLAVKLYSGFDITPDFVEAMKWAEKLAEQHDVAAQVMMGNMYANGDTKGGKRNLPRAYSWYSIAASEEPQAENNPKATDDQIKGDELIPSAMEGRDKIAELISAKEEADAQKFATNWWAKHPPPVKPKEMSKEDMAKMAKEPAAKAMQPK
ncbi:MAG: sel1 repeat family protein [Methylophilales bacterium]|nr:sel1 repeat family protein [Methylophilales bacterium]